VNFLTTLPQQLGFLSFVTKITKKGCLQSTGGSTLSVIGSSFLACYTTTKGGVYVSHNVEISITNTTFQENSAQEGSALFLESFTDCNQINLESCTFSDNMASNSGIQCDFSQFLVFQEQSSWKLPKRLVARFLILASSLTILRSMVLQSPQVLYFQVIMSNDSSFFPDSSPFFSTFRP
jgi:hypothetical protein